MSLREFISVAASAAASAFGAIGIWLVAVAIAEHPPDASRSLFQNIATVLHPGVWYVLAAVVARQVGRVSSK
ncbi:hypothetical protein [Methylobacterium sp. GC_Met_2]|uniref:hypothetical protein n=1 Tax=Methylobacterium sp. GC_Met_2 TaxID=2937376 RepID=UPI00226B26CB|nr:hypothetical protein [Methylobacterium sp. GC_Met_2]